MSDQNMLGRRTFLEVVGAATACAGISALPGCGGSGTNTDSFSAGQVSSYTAGSWKMFDTNTSIVALDSTGFYAYSNICTHAGCHVLFTNPGPGGPDTSADGLTQCPCHGSTYGGDGSVTGGPSTEPLPHFEVTIAGGVVTVNPGTTVAANSRTTA